jgi:hypothetical protein
VNAEPFMSRSVVMPGRKQQCCKPCRELARCIFWRLPPITTARLRTTASLMKPTLAALQRLKETLLSRDDGPGRQILRKFNTETVNASGIASDEWSLLRPLEPVGMRRCAPAGL